MNKYKKQKITFGIIISLFVLYGLYNWLQYTAPLIGSKQSVTKYLLNTIPYGTSWDDTIDIIKEHKIWEIRAENCTGGLSIYKSGYVAFEDYEDKENPEIQIIGVKALDVFLGEYNAPFSTSVRAYLVFDEKDELIEVRLRKYVDTL